MAVGWFEDRVMYCGLDTGKSGLYGENDRGYSQICRSMIVMKFLFVTRDCDNID